MTDKQVQLARNLLERAGHPEAEQLPDDVLCYCLDTAHAVIGEERSPDRQWHKDYYSITGEHMVLLDEGWAPADMGYDPVEIHDEVNAN